MKTCPNCGAQVADNSLFCTECGKQIPQGNVCSHCGAPVNNGDSFCQNCGNKVDGQQASSATAPEQKHCPHCGAIVSSDGVFCENCGKNMSSGGSVLNMNFQPQMPYTTEGDSQNKFVLPIVVGLLVLALAGGGWWYYKSSKNSTNNEILQGVADNVSSVTDDGGNVGNSEVYSKVKENGSYKIDTIEKVESDIFDDDTSGYESVLSTRKLIESDLSSKTKKELEIMRNSIYARYGYRFKRDDLFNHFSQFSWYNPTTSDMSTVYNSMSDIEKYNVDFIKKHE